MNLALACCLSFGLGIACTLACCWRRLSLAEHLREELQELYSVGTSIAVDPKDLYFVRNITLNARAKDFAAFNRRLTAAKELLQRIEERKRP